MLIDENDPFRPPFGDTELFTVYAISIDGVAIRRYADVRESWQGNNKIGVWIGISLIVASLSMGAFLVWKSVGHKFDY